MGAPSTASCEASKLAGNEAVAARDFEAAERHYTEALAALPADGQAALQGEWILRATLLSNRAYARQQRGLWQQSADDAAAALDLLPQDGSPAAGAQGADLRADVQRLRVKALYRRGLAQEALGRPTEAFGDLNWALKLAPSNEGIVAAAKRVQQAMPTSVKEVSSQPYSPAWVPEHPYGTKLVMKLADSDRFPGRTRGFTTLGSDPVVKFANGLGVAAHHGHGGLSAILPLGPPRLLPRTRERQDTGKVVAVPGPPELGDAYFSAPNMVPADGVRLKYSRGGDLQWICSYKEGKLDGLVLRLELEGFLRYEECGLYQHGRLVEKWQNCLLPEGYLGQVLTEVVVPMKKALGIDLSPCEQRLCYESYVPVDGIAPAELGRRPGDEPEVPRRLSGHSARPREWWLPQMQVADPSRKYDQDSRRPGEFAPVGPGCMAEVVPFGGGFPYLEVPQDGDAESEPAFLEGQSAQGDTS